MDWRQCTPSRRTPFSLRPAALDIDADGTSWALNRRGGEQISAEIGFTSPDASIAMQPMRESPSKRPATAESSPARPATRPDALTRANTPAASIPASPQPVRPSSPPDVLALPSHAIHARMLPGFAGRGCGVAFRGGTLCCERIHGVGACSTMRRVRVDESSLRHLPHTSVCPLTPSPPHAHTFRFPSRDFSASFAPETPPD